MTTLTSNLVTDPAFVAAAAADFDLSPASPAIDGGTAVAGMAYAGAPDIGAFEQPVATTASAACGGHIVVEVAAAFRPMRVPDCTGFAVHQGTRSLALAACTATATGIDLALEAPSAAVLTVDYAGDRVTDGLAAGGSVGARLRPFTGLRVQAP